VSLPRILVTVASDAGGGWTVSVTDAAAGRELAAYPMDAVELDLGYGPQRFPAVPLARRPDAGDEHAALCAGDKTAIAGILDRLARQDPGDGDVRVYGRWLFQCLLAPAWTDLRAGAPGGMELALQWPTEETGLQSLIWEAMHDGDFPLAGRPDLLVAVTRIIRAPEGVGPPEPLARSPRVLFATGSSLADPVIRPGLMFMGLLRRFDAEGISVTRTAYDVSLSELEAECRQFRPDVVHLVAHGRQPAGGGTLLRLGGEDVTAGQLRQALTAGQSSPVAVVLSACHTADVNPVPGEIPGGPGEAVAGRAAPVAAELVAGGIPIVTAMAGAVSEPACRLYTTQLIDAIHQGKPLSLAAAEGRAAALVSAAAPSEQLDWAMPTTFLASNVPPDYCPLKPSALRQLVQVADNLNLRWHPVFIGRQDILKMVDDVFSADHGHAKFVAIICQGKIEKLGSTRLLREIGFRLLRAGHVPLLLADYPPSGFGQVPSAPANLRALLKAILEQVVEVARQFGVRPPPLTSLAVDPSLAGHDAVTGAGLADLDPENACQRARLALSAFANSSTALDDASVVQIPLAADLAGLAASVVGPEPSTPFGPDSRVVVLADRVHEWTGGLGVLLSLIGSHGLGRPGRPVPVVVTGSNLQNAGSALEGYVTGNSGNPGVRYGYLDRLTEEEATLGFQWVLLNPWKQDPDRDRRRVYVAAPGSKSQVAAQREFDRHLDKLPAKARNEVYTVAGYLVRDEEFVDHDDIKLLDEYASRHP
jgi:hypothetical protein